MLIKAFDAALASYQIVLLSRGVALVIWDQRVERRGILGATIDGRPVRRPYASIAVKDVTGHPKSIMAIRLPADIGADSVLILRQDKDVLAEIAILITNESGAAAADRIAEDLDAPSRMRLFRFVLDYCRMTFELDDSRVAAFCRRLVERAAAAPQRLRCHAGLTADLRLFCADFDARLGKPDVVYRIAPRSVRRNSFPPAVIGGSGAKAQLALILEGDDANEIIVVAGPDSGACFIPGRGAPRHLLDLVEREGRLAPALERYIVASLAEAAGKQPQAAALLHDMQVIAPRPAVQLRDPERPVGVSLELALDDGAGGIFAKGWIRDPLGMVESLHLTSPFGEHQLRDADRFRFRRSDVEASYAEARHGRAAAVDGFIIHLPDAAGPVPIHQYGLRAMLRSGATVNVTSPLAPLLAGEARDAVLGSVPPAALTDTLLARGLAPPSMALHEMSRRGRCAAELVEIGLPRRSATVSIIVPLYRNLSFLRFQIAALAAEPAIGEAEVIYVLDSPEQRGDVEHLLRGLGELYGLPMKLVVMAANAGYAAANNTGAEHAHGRLLLLLNSDVIPERPGWLSPLVGALDDPAFGAAGPKLLFEDGSLQHAGMYFATDARGGWYNDHFFKGFPRDYPGACVAREVPAVTGAALLVRRGLFEAVGGFTEDYIIGDYEDSDLCLKIRRAGKKIRYQAEVELYHFERRSIRLHPGYTRTVAAAYNRWLHAGRWGDAMAALMEAPAKPRSRRTVHRVAA
jgi:GT2 family glycosyltransferase